MKTENNSGSTNKLKLNILYIIILLSFGFILYLAYTNQSPIRFAKSFLSSFTDKQEKYDNTNVINKIEPFDESEIISSLVKILNQSGQTVKQENVTGENVTKNFLSFADLSEDFKSLSYLVSTWENKFLAFDKSTLFLFQVSGKDLFMRKMKVPDVEKIEYAFIFKSGNILFGDHKNLYYSDDNLSTYNKSKLFDADGKEFKPDNYGNFYCLVTDVRQIINGKELRVWGNYTNYGAWVPGAERSTQVQVWYTADEGRTVRMAYKFNTDSTMRARHVHSVNFCLWDNSFWIQSGDMFGECNWIQGKYNIESDIWTWNVKATGDHMSYYKTTGFVFHNDTLFWSDDSSDPQKHGIWKTPYSNMIADKIDETKFQKAFESDKEMTNFTGYPDGFMLGVQDFKSLDGKHKIFVSEDGGLSWKTIETAYQIANIHRKNDFGLVLGNYFVNQPSFESIHFWDWKPSLFVNSYIENNADTK